MKIVQVNKKLKTISDARKRVLPILTAQEKAQSRFVLTVLLSIAKGIILFLFIITLISRKAATTEKLASKIHSSRME
jgi:hypothetical protein